ncbi:MAG: hypothetical protein WBM40_18185 [Thiohalocapsa sp.]
MTEPARTTTYKIGAQSLRQRTQNVLYGAGLSLLLLLLVGWGHLEQPQTYNDVLLWSVVGFVVLANAIGYWRHRRYLGRARQHRLEVGAGRIQFRTGDEGSELALSDVAGVTVHRRGGHIGHIQIQRTDHRGIRLEGYEDIDDLAAALKAQIPVAHWRDG